MYLHIGLNEVITYDEIIGIFDLDNTTVKKSTRDYLAKAEKAKQVKSVCMDLPKSFIVCEKNGERKIYITQLSVATLKNRVEENFYLKHYETAYKEYKKNPVTFSLDEIETELGLK